MSPGFFLAAKRSVRAKRIVNGHEKCNAEYRSKTAGTRAALMRKQATREHYSALLSDQLGANCLTIAPGNSDEKCCGAVAAAKRS